MYRMPCSVLLLKYSSVWYVQLVFSNSHLFLFSVVFIVLWIRSTGILLGMIELIM